MEKNKKNGIQNSVQKNDRIELTITDLSKTGEGIGKADGFVFFVKDAIPGDRIEAIVTKCKKTYGYAHLSRVLTPSPERVDAPCPVARVCGGCQLQALSYLAQLAWKQELVRSVLEKIGGLKIVDDGIETAPSGKAERENEETMTYLAPIVSCEKPLRYRNKAILPVQESKDGTPIVGFYAGHSHRVVPCEDCLLGAEENGAIVQVVLDWMRDVGIPAYNEQTGEGVLRHLFVRRSRETGKTHLCLIGTAKKLTKTDRLREKLEADERTAGRICGASYNQQTERGNTILGKRTTLLWGDQMLTDVLRSEKYGISCTYRIAPESFYQVNPDIAEKIYETVLDLAALKGTETVLDLYCGIGTITLFLASQAKEVIGVEVVPEAIQNAQENALQNGAGNVRFLEGKAEDVVPAWLKKEGRRADLVVVDPPRKGCDVHLLETIREIAPEKIVYVSCDPATLARDLKILTGYGYRTEHVVPFDQFAMTTHVEAVILLSLANC